MDFLNYRIYADVTGFDNNPFTLNGSYRQLISKYGPIVHLKRLSSRGFRDIFDHHLDFFSEHNGYYKTGAYW